MRKVAVRRVAKNTIIMFVRMIVLMIISFLTSRWLLKELGVVDYGIYSVVGSVTATFVALKSLFSESTQRFLNYYKGKEDLQAQKDIYSISIIVHITLAIAFVLILELVGMWLINNKLVFPTEKFATIIFVFQMTVVASIFSILSIPFDALIIANERLTFFALVSILDGLLRLAVVIALPFISYNSLRTYSLLLVFIPILTLILYGYYCRQFPECEFSKVFNKSLFKEIVSLSGWNFFGNLSFSLLHEGINFVLNIFGGLVYNAARAIAYQVKNIVVQFSNNSLIAVRPMVMQSAASGGDNRLLYKNVIEISRISFMLILIPIAPLEAFCLKLLQFWLVNVPDCAVLFTRLVLLSVLFRSFHEPLNMLYMSVGKIKRMILIETIIMFGALIGIYIGLSNGAPLWLSFVILAFMELVIMLSLLINAKLELNFNAGMFLKNVLVPMALLFITTEIVIWLFSNIKSDSTLLTFLLCACVITAVLIIIIFFLNKREKSIIKSLILNKI